MTQIVGGNKLFSRITFLAVFLLWPFIAISQALEPTSKSWSPRGSSTIRWMGPIIASDDRIVFSSEEALELRLLVPRLSWMMLNQSRTEAIVQSERAQLFAATGNFEKLKSGYRLCAIGPVTFVVAWENPPDGLSLEFFSGNNLPTESGGKNSCGTASFFDSNWIFTQTDDQALENSGNATTKTKTQTRSTATERDSAFLASIADAMIEKYCPIYGKMAYDVVRLRQEGVSERDVKESFSHAQKKLSRQMHQSNTTGIPTELVQSFVVFNENMFDLIITSAYRIRVASGIKDKEYFRTRFRKIIEDSCIKGITAAYSDTNRHDVMKIYGDSDIAGGDLTKSGIRNISEDACASLCSKDAECKAYSYVVSKRWCWPKSGVTELVTRLGVNSGVVTVSPVVSSDTQQLESRSEATGRSADRSDNVLPDEECDAIAQIAQTVAGWRDFGMSLSAAQSQISVAVRQSNVSASTASGIVSHVYKYSSTSPTELYYQFKVACAIK